MHRLTLKVVPFRAEDTILSKQVAVSFRYPAHGHRMTAAARSQKFGLGRSKTL